MATRRFIEQVLFMHLGGLHECSVFTKTKTEMADSIFQICLTEFVMTLSRNF